ncbi:MAG: hypothetical protein IPH66_17560 [Crocinitomicaceae bacterium]|nr:hypothetical protein [Crocinitomicaceae bacterium]
MVESDFSTEGSEPAKVGTEEHEVHKRLIKMDEQAHHCEVQRVPKFYTVDVPGIDGRNTLLPGEVFNATS